MRIISLFSLIVFVCAAAFCGCVSGENTVTISTYDYTNWTYLVDNLSSTDNSEVTVRLECDIYNNTFRIGDPTKGAAVINISSGNKTLDLNGHNINLNNSIANDYFILFNVTNGSKFTINNSVSSESCIAANVSTMVSVSSGGDFTLGENVNLTTYGRPNPPPIPPSVFPSGYDYNTSMVIAIQGQGKTASDIINVKLDESSTVFDNADYDNDYTIGIVHKGYPYSWLNNKASGVNLEICGNVTGHRGIWLDAGAKDFNFYPNITINSSAVIDAYRGCAVYAAGYGNWIFNGGKLNGTEALSIRSGNFTIKGGTFKGSGDYHDPPKRFSDMKLAYFTGAAVSIVNNSSDTNHVSNVSIPIKDGTFKSKNGYAFLETSLKGGSALSSSGITISDGTFITDNSSKLYPIYISNLNNKNVKVTIKEKTLLYPYLNLSAARWTNDTNGNWNVTLYDNISNLKSINLTLDGGKTATLDLNGKKITSPDGKLLGWNNSTSEPGNVIIVKQTDPTVFDGGSEYYPLFGHYVFFNNSSGSGTMDDQPFVNGTTQNLSKNNFTRTGYKFIGWNNTSVDRTVVDFKDEESVSQSNSITHDTTLYAVWAKITNVTLEFRNESSDPNN
ncbi:MAG TPA: InlB B-repeat-containing protein, partial [Methanocorpusculum sp.]|nr:InlB B-repeat-containing protein [Methanocorpusculum sp.]